MFVLQVFFWVLFIYGFLSLVQDIFNEFTYKKINHDMKIVIFASKLEEKLENYNELRSRYIPLFVQAGADLNQPSVLGSANQILKEMKLRTTQMMSMM